MGLIENPQIYTTSVYVLHMSVVLLSQNLFIWLPTLYVPICVYGSLCFNNKLIIEYLAMNMAYGVHMRVQAPHDMICLAKKKTTNSIDGHCCGRMVWFAYCSIVHFHLQFI